MVQCQLCHEEKPRDAFSKSQLKREESKCKECVVAWEASGAGQPAPGPVMSNTKPTTKPGRTTPAAVAPDWQPSGPSTTTERVVPPLQLPAGQPQLPPECDCFPAADELLADARRIARQMCLEAGVADPNEYLDQDMLRDQAQMQAEEEDQEFEKMAAAAASMRAQAPKAVHARKAAALERLQALLEQDMDELALSDKPPVRMYDVPADATAAERKEAETAVEAQFEEGMARLTRTVLEATAILKTEFTFKSDDGSLDTSPESRVTRGFAGMLDFKIGGPLSSFLNSTVTSETAQGAMPVTRVPLILAIAGVIKIVASWDTFVFNRMLGSMGFVCVLSEIVQWAMGRSFERSFERREPLEAPSAADAEALRLAQVALQQAVLDLLVYAVSSVSVQVAMLEDAADTDGDDADDYDDSEEDDSESQDSNVDGADRGRGGDLMTLVVDMLAQSCDVKLQYTAEMVIWHSIVTDFSGDLMTNAWCARGMPGPVLLLLCSQAQVPLPSGKATSDGFRSEMLSKASSRTLDGLNATGKDYCKTVLGPFLKERLLDTEVAIGGRGYLGQTVVCGASLYAPDNVTFRDSAACHQEFPAPGAAAFGAGARASGQRADADKENAFKLHGAAAPGNGPGVGAALKSLIGRISFSALE